MDIGNLMAFLTHSYASREETSGEAPGPSKCAFNFFHFLIWSRLYVAAIFLLCAPDKEQRRVAWIEVKPLETRSFPPPATRVVPSIPAASRPGRVRSGEITLGAALERRERLERLILALATSQGLKEIASDTIALYPEISGDLIINPDPSNLKQVAWNYLLRKEIEDHVLIEYEDLSGALAKIGRP